MLTQSGPIAQSVEQMAFNHWVEGSSPSRITIILKSGKRNLSAFFVLRFLTLNVKYLQRLFVGLILFRIKVPKQWYDLIRSLR